MRKIMMLLAGLTVLSLGIVFPSYAETAYGHGYFEYYIVDGGIEICNYMGNEEVVEVPNNISGLPVSGIAEGAFVNCPSVKSLILPDTIMYIEEGAISPSIQVTYLGKQFGNDSKIEESISTDHEVAADSVNDSDNPVIVSDGVVTIEEATSDSNLKGDESEEMPAEIVISDDEVEKEELSQEEEKSTEELMEPRTSRRSLLWGILCGLSVILLSTVLLLKRKKE